MSPFHDPLLIYGVIGGIVLGYYLGSKMRHIDAAAPGGCAILGGIFGGLFLRTVLTALMVIALVVGPPFVFWYFRGIIRHFTTAFGQAAGVSFRHLLSRRTHRSKLHDVERRHQQRLAALYDADIPRDSLEKLLEQERRRFDTELQHLGRGS